MISKLSLSALEMIFEPTGLVFEKPASPATYLEPRERGARSVDRGDVG